MISLRAPNNLLMGLRQCLEFETRNTVLHSTMYGNLKPFISMKGAEFW